MTQAGTLVNCVRDFGGLTEPFIEQRLAAGVLGLRTELWYERSRVDPSIPSRRIHLPVGAPGSAFDRVFHRVPALGRWAMTPYHTQELAVRPVLIHAHYGTTGYWIGEVTRAPLLVSMYGFDASVIPRRRAWRAAYRKLASRAARILVEGPYMRATVIELGFSPDMVDVLPIATDACLSDSLAADADQLGNDRAVADPVRLLACGRLVEKKGHDIAVRAFASIRTALPKGSSLEIVGGGPLFGHLQRLVASLDLGDAVRLSGPLPRADFRDRLRAADLFLAPSRTASNGDSEGGAPTTILDAQATGTIVVASNHADIPFLIEDGVTGYLAEEGSPAELGSAIVRALSDRPVWMNMRAAARTVILTRHTPAVASANLRAIYMDVLGGRAS